MQRQRCVEDGLPECILAQIGERVDDENVGIDGQLHEAQFGVVGLLAQELGIETGVPDRGDAAGRVVD